MWVVGAAVGPFDSCLHKALDKKSKVWILRLHQKLRTFCPNQAIRGNQYLTQWQETFLLWLKYLRRVWWASGISPLAPSELLEKGHLWIWGRVAALQVSSRNTAWKTEPSIGLTVHLHWLCCIFWELQCCWTGDRCVNTDYLGLFRKPRRDFSTEVLQC